MRFGHFDDARREYVILTPQTPLPWINYLGSEDFFALVSNTAGGYCFYKDARLRRLTRYRYNASPLDTDGFHVYIRDGNTVWNPGWQPTQTALDRYTCRHGLGYTVLESEKDGVAARQELFVPRGDNCLLARLTVRNDTDAAKLLDVFPYVEFCLWDAMDDSSNFQRNYSIGEVELSPDAICTRPSTASGAITTRSSGPAGPSTAATPRATPFSASTAPRRGPRPCSRAAAPGASPTAGRPWAPCSSI
jgi:cellobiose phosphorylase